MKANNDTTGSGAFLRVLRGLLRPLVRTMIARGLTAPVVYSLLKRIYVEVAETHFALDDKSLTDSRIAMLTGVHRKDIRTIRGETDGGATEARRKSTLLATVVGQWMTHPDFVDASGAPRALPRSDAGFDALVRSVSKDVRPRTVLDELTRAGLVSEGADGTLSLKAEAVVGTGSTADREAFFAANVGDHLAAAAENLLADQPPFFERAVFYNQMSPDAVDAVEDIARREAQALLEALSQKSSDLRRDEADANGPRQRYRMGVYFYREDAEAPQDDKGSDQP
ncbi:DUF6502 family protein [Tateyamaria sp. SN6-1]|uniref:DUF6502 family protein n=1 Tax=Tateyamaria sp. SN6-1 TaxID=3092148 RepID=UPI0039F49032